MRNILIAAVLTVFTACGRADDQGLQKLSGGKAGAASALYDATGPLSKMGADRNGSGINITSTTSIKGEASGSADISVMASTDADYNPTNATVVITFNDYSDDGQTKINGKLNVTQAVDAASGAETMKLSGDLHYSGLIGDDLNADVTMSLASADLNAPSASVDTVLSGTISTSTDTYTFNNEQVTVH